ncbi:MAG: TIGR02710 family CRISPR-associated protein [Myxococcales bacterium]|nr:TIGR02710 family CRISPR-associated protein [Myxococcales bacterium]
MLVVTVGGSHAPILKSISWHEPDFVWFVFSEDDASAGPRGIGSHSQITGEGQVCRSGGQQKPDLPNIPTQLGLGRDRFEVLCVPADEPARAVELIVDLLERLRSDLAVRDLRADYTGGTKSMSAALLHAAVLAGGVRLFVTTGPRPNLVRVPDGHESTQHIDDDALTSSWRVRDAERAWARFAYGEAARLLDRLDRKSDRSSRLLTMSRGLAAWDAFDHRRAFILLQQYARQLDHDLIAALGQMRAPEDGRPPKDPRRVEALRVHDLYLASARRAAAGRHDTEVLLLYRAFEWIAQWTLRFYHAIDTGDVPADDQLADLAHVAHDGKRKLGLHNAWTAIGRLDGPLAEVGRATEKTRLDFGKRRNQSIFAHGFAPISAAEARKARAWFEADVLPAFQQVAFDGRAPFPQLPTAAPR